VELFVRSVGKHMLQKMRTEPKINLGDKVKHAVSGMTGIVVGRTEWLNGCWRMTIQPQVKKDGTLPDASSFDDIELIVVEKGAFQKRVEPKKRKKIGKKDTGGPRPEVTRFSY